MRRLLWLALASTLLAGCTGVSAGSRGEQARLLVFAAASLTDAFTEMGAAFEASQPGTTVTFNFAGSQTLRTQIEAGAPVDVFASANAREMDALVTAGMVRADAPRIFLTNRLVVILPASNPAGVETLQDLTAPGLKLVLAAQEVPVGNYARQSLEKMDASLEAGFSQRVLANVVSNEDNVKQVVTKVQLGEADAGIVYASDAVAAPDLRKVEIPPDLNVIASYPLAALQDSAHPDLAQSFVAYVLSKAGQAVLEKWGFAPAG